MLNPNKLAASLPGFDVNLDDTGQNDTKNKKKKKPGGFIALGLSFPILKGISKRGYKQPTPIQRKSIPLALDGKDVVAMARTGSGKTACFLLPILEKLISPANKSAPGKNLRALILSPTRELSIQTVRFVRELGKFTGLKCAAILGGESLEQQFSVMSGTVPDIVVATPGRFLHLCVEMNLQLSNIKIVVFDEADRLFELGFGEQLREIVARLPSGRQSLLFSATLPKMLVEFAKAGLTSPVLIRLDVEWKLPSTLWLGWISVRAELKTAALLLLLDKVLTPNTPQAVVFAATKHHVDYLNLVLQEAGINAACVYSQLDPTARKIALGRFTNKRCSVLIVTDVAARGLDLPALDTVINYNFPAKPKLFVHRVGRSARAGRAGRAFSLVAAEDLAHLLDLQLFLGTELISPNTVDQYGPACPSGVWGSMPASQLEMRHQDVLKWEKQKSDIEDAARVCSRAWQQYLKWREAASAEANRRAKSTVTPSYPHPFLLSTEEMEMSAPIMTAADIVQKIRNYTSKGTILELTAKIDSPMYLAMKAKRRVHGKTVQKTRESKNEESLNESLKTSKNKAIVRDENYIPHQASDQHTETGMSVNFGACAAAAELEIAADSSEGARRMKSQMRWDRKRKKMVHVDPDGGKKMIRTESGGRIPATYRSGRFDEWKKRNSQAEQYSDDDDEGPAQKRPKPVSEFRPHWMKHNERISKKRATGVNEMKDKHQIVKQRIRKDNIKAHLKQKMKKKKRRK